VINLIAKSCRLVAFIAAPFVLLAAVTASTIGCGNPAVKDPRAAAAGTDALPDDVPLYPAATLDAVRRAEAVETFELRARATAAEINRFYREELQKRGWSHQIEGAASDNGLYFMKSGRSLSVVIVEHPGAASEIHLVVGTIPARRSSRRNAIPIAVT
jgi:hypothetical protein